MDEKKDTRQETDEERARRLRRQRRIRQEMRRRRRRRALILRGVLAVAGILIVVLLIWGISALAGKIGGGEKKKWLRETFQGDCTEMEGAAIAQAAYLNQVPFLIVRAISDKADDSVAVDYKTFEAAAIRHAVRLVEAMLEKL